MQANILWGWSQLRKNGVSHTYRKQMSFAAFFCDKHAP